MCRTGANGQSPLGKPPPAVFSSVPDPLFAYLPACPAGVVVDEPPRPKGPLTSWTQRTCVLWCRGPHVRTSHSTASPRSWYSPSETSPAGRNNSTHPGCFSSRPTTHAAPRLQQSHPPFCLQSHRAPPSPQVSCAAALAPCGASHPPPQMCSSLTSLFDRAIAIRFCASTHCNFDSGQLKSNRKAQGRGEHRTGGCRASHHRLSPRTRKQCLAGARWPAPPHASSTPARPGTPSFLPTGAHSLEDSREVP